MNSIVSIYMIFECLFNKSRYSDFLLLCSYKFESQDDLLNHYVSYHNVDKNNWFFQELLQIKDKSVLKRCLRCDEFLVTDKHKVVHNFLIHYEDGKIMAFEKKPLDIFKFPGLTIYFIEFQKHKYFYDFYNSEVC